MTLLQVLSLDSSKSKNIRINIKLPEIGILQEREADNTNYLLPITIVY